MIINLISKFCCTYLTIEFHNLLCVLFLLFIVFIISIHPVITIHPNAIIVIDNPNSKLNIMPIAMRKINMTVIKKSSIDWLLIYSFWLGEE